MFQVMYDMMSTVPSVSTVRLQLRIRNQQKPVFEITWAT